MAASVVVVSYNSGLTLPGCLAAALADPLCAELILVDNGSTDGSLDWLASQTDPRLRLLPQGRNLGFGTACNRGAAVAAEPILVFLNPDCELAPGALAALCAALEAHAGEALAGALLVDAEGEPDCRNLARADPSPMRMFKIALGGGDLSQAVDLASAQAQPVANVSGALMALGRTFFDRLGGFDEGYFLHVEDLDLCRRVRAAGKPVLFVATAWARHGKGGSSGGHALRVHLHKHRGLLRYFSKFERAASPWPVRLLFPILIRARMLALAPLAWFKDRRRR